MKEFPKGTSWDTVASIVELTPENMTEYFSNSQVLDVPFVIRGFLNQSNTVFDLTKYADVNHLRESVNGTYEYNFDANDHAEKLTLPDAIDKMLGGHGLYMKFNRDFTINEPVIANAVDAATAKLVELGGPVVKEALADAWKVTFMTIGSQMNTKIHNAMSANWFFQIAGIKDWKIYDPRHSIYLQPYNLPNAIASASSFDTSFPQGPPYIATRTNPGDFLYFPSFWLHEVDNYGPGLKLAIGLRPSIQAVQHMWKTALLPFYENPKGTTGLALCHLGPSLKLIADLTAAKFSAKWKAAFGETDPLQANDVEVFQSEKDGRGTDWWVKSSSKRYKQKNAGDQTIDEMTANINF